MTLIITPTMIHGQSVKKSCLTPPSTCCYPYSQPDDDMTKHVPLLIIGAGPYGLAMAAYAGHRRLDYVICGHPMDFWKSNMPRGMLLRSSWDWHIDPLGVHTLQAYASAHNVNTDRAEPIPLDLFLRYAAWFQQEKAVQAQIGRASCRERW